MRTSGRPPFGRGGSRARRVSVGRSGGGRGPALVCGLPGDPEPGGDLPPAVAGRRSPATASAIAASSSAASAASAGRASTSPAATRRPAARRTRRPNAVNSAFSTTRAAARPGVNVGVDGGYGCRRSCRHAPPPPLRYGRLRGEPGRPLAGVCPLVPPQRRAGSSPAMTSASQSLGRAPGAHGLATATPAGPARRRPGRTAPGPRRRHARPATPVPAEVGGVMPHPQLVPVRQRPGRVRGRAALAAGLPVRGRPRARTAAVAGSRRPAVAAAPQREGWGRAWTQRARTRHQAVYAGMFFLISASRPARIGVLGCRR